ncbi:protein of unknown function (plasmid) [Pararobbsia alpina]
MRAVRAIPGLSIGLARPIALSITIAPEFAAYGGRGSVQLLSNRSWRLIADQRPRYLLALRQR